MATHPDPVSLAADPGSGAVQFDTRRVDGGGGALRLTLGYRRSVDFDPRDDAGQDHAVVRAGRGRAVGVVADGVSQSFFGDIAARCLAEGLADFLWRHAGAPPAAETVATELARLRVPARRQVEDRAIPADVPELARTGLERLRGSTGSQAVFAAFVLDAERHLAHVYTVGDAAAVLHGGSPGATLAVPVEAAGRWATHGAPPLGLRADRYAGVSAVVVRSDGARGWGDVLPGTDAEQAFREQAPRLAGYDDVAFVIAQLEGTAAPAVPLVLEASARVERLPGVEAEHASAPGVPLPPAAAASSAPVPVREDQPPRLEGGGPVDTALGERSRRLVPLPRLRSKVRRKAAAALVLLAVSAGAGAQVWLGGNSGEPGARPDKPARPIVPAQRERNQPVVVHRSRVPAAAGETRPPAGDDPNAALTEAIAAANAREQAREEARAAMEAREEARPAREEGRAERLQFPPDLRLDPAVPRTESGHVETPNENRRPGSARPSGTRPGPRTPTQPERTQPRTQPDRTQPERNRTRSQPAGAGQSASAEPAAPVAPVPVAPVPAARVPSALKGPAAPGPRLQEPPRPDTPSTGSPDSR